LTQFHRGQKSSLWIVTSTFFVKPEKRATEYARESGMKWMSASTDRECDRALITPRTSPWFAVCRGALFGSWSEKGVRLTQQTQVGPCIPVGVQLWKAVVSPTFGPTWQLSHLAVDVAELWLPCTMTRPGPGPVDDQGAEQRGVMAVEEHCLACGRYLGLALRNLAPKPRSIQENAICKTTDIQIPSRSDWPWLAS
jgi:hypothetical protein